MSALFVLKVSNLRGRQTSDSEQGFLLGRYSLCSKLQAPSSKLQAPSCSNDRRENHLGTRGCVFRPRGRTTSTDSSPRRPFDDQALCFVLSTQAIPGRVPIPRPERPSR